MLNTLKVIFVILGIIFLGVGVIAIHSAWGAIIVGLLLLAVAVFIDERAKSQPGVARGVGQVVASIFIVGLGVSLWALIRIAGGLPNLDTTGEIPASATITGCIVGGLVIVVGLVVINHSKK